MGHSSLSFVWSHLCNGTGIHSHCLHQFASKNVISQGPFSYTSLPTCKIIKISTAYHTLEGDEDRYHLPILHHLGPSSMYRSGPFFWMGEKRVTSSKKWVMSPIFWKLTSMWGAGLLGFPTL